MAITGDRLGIQTYSYRGLPPRAVPARVRADGLARVELCTMQADWRRPDEVDTLARAYANAGVAIDALGVHQPGSAHDHAVCAFAKRVGARFVGIDLPPTLSAEPLRLAERLAERWDLRFAIHNHGGAHWLGSRAMLAAVLADCSPRIGLCLDTAWALDAGEDPIATARRFGDRLYGVHVKDFVFDRAGRERDVVVGEGNLDLGALAGALDDVGFAGWAALEYEGEPEDPSPAIRACVAAARAKLCTPALEARHA